MNHILIVGSQKTYETSGDTLFFATSSGQKSSNSNVLVDRYRPGIFSQSGSSKKTKRRPEKFCRPELSSGLNSDSLVGPEKESKSHIKENPQEKKSNAEMARLKLSDQ